MKKASGFEHLSNFVAVTMLVALFATFIVGEISQNEIKKVAKRELPGKTIGVKADNLNLEAYFIVSDNPIYSTISMSGTNIRAEGVLYIKSPDGCQLTGLRYDKGRGSLEIGCLNGPFWTANNFQGLYPGHPSWVVYLSIQSVDTVDHMPKAP